MGKGSAARVYIGKDTATRQLYALKAVQGAARRRVPTEVELHAALRHSHIVPLVRHFADAQCDYMLLALCNNHSLADVLRWREGISEPEARYYLRQTLSALDYVRRKGLIHRDIKPANLLLHNMVVKLGDFGLACRAADAARERSLCGTPNYVAPELLRREPPSASVDVWAAGVVLYTLLVGEEPFRDRDIASTYARILSHSYAVPRAAALSPDAERFIAWLLSADPRQRPSAELAFSHAWFAQPTPDALPKRALRQPL